MFLQEVWVKGDAQLIAETAAKGHLTHSHHYVAGLFGSGLVLLSRFPIQVVRMNSCYVNKSTHLLICLSNV